MLRLHTSILVIAVGSLSSQTPGWSQVSSTVKPPARSAHAMAYDAARGKTLLFGGRDASNTIIGDMWEWDGSNWSRRTPGVLPFPRVNHVMIYDHARQRVVLYGGGNIGGPLNDTWEWNGSIWQIRIPAQSPPGANWVCAAYHHQRATTVVVLSVPPALETWEWNGTVWSRTNVTTPPAFLQGGQMAYDIARNRLIYGIGTGTSLSFFELGASAWTPLTTSDPPPPRALSIFFYYPARGHIMLHNSGGPPLDDVHALDGNRWMPHQRGTPTNLWPAGAMDEQRQRLTVFGGTFMGQSSDQTWEYWNPHRATWSAYGAGCLGSNGVPALAMPFGEEAWIGRGARFELTRLPTSNNPAFLLIGAIRMNVDLTVIGMTACTLLASADATLPASSSGGRATFYTGLPYNVSFLGATFYAQAFVLDPIANPLGISASNGIDARVGSL